MNTIIFNKNLKKQLMKENSPIPTTSFFSMISDPIRNEILNFLLIKKNGTVSEIIEWLNKPQTLISYHLRCLKECELIDKIKSRKDGRNTIYSLHDTEFVENIFSLARTYLLKHEMCKQHEACQIE